MHHLKLAGITLKKHILDNECSNKFKMAIQEYRIDFKLVPKNQQRRDIAEKGIQTCKLNAISVFLRFDDSCPPVLWDLMLEQINCQVNLLCMENEAPEVSVYVHLYGQHNFNRCPFAPPGIQANTYIRSGKQGSWAVTSKKAIILERHANTTSTFILMSQIRAASRTKRQCTSNIHTSQCPR